MLNYVCTFQIWSEKKNRMSYEALMCFEPHFASDWAALPMIFCHRDATFICWQPRKDQELMLLLRRTYRLNPMTLQSAGRQLWPKKNWIRQNSYPVYNILFERKQRKSHLKNKQIGSLKIFGPSPFHDTLSPDYAKSVFDVFPSRLARVITSESRISCYCEGKKPETLNCMTHTCTRLPPGSASFTPLIKKAALPERSLKPGWLLFILLPFLSLFPPQALLVWSPRCLPLPLQPPPQIDGRAAFLDVGI